MKSWGVFWLVHITEGYIWLILDAWNYLLSGLSEWILSKEDPERAETVSKFREGDLGSAARSQASSIGVTWELVSNAHAQVPPRPPEPEMLERRPSLLCFDKPSKGFTWPSRVSGLKDEVSGQVCRRWQSWGWRGLCCPRFLILWQLCSTRYLILTPSQALSLPRCCS